MVLSFIFLFIVLVAALFPENLLPHNPNRVTMMDRLLPPFWADGANSLYPLGTDHLGRDIYSRLIFSARYTLLVSTLSVTVGCVIGAIAGLVAGFSGGGMDTLIGRLADMQLAFPVILLLLVAVAVFGQSLRNLILIFGISEWAGFARIIRGSTLALRRCEFVEAARSIGASDGRIIFREILPNIAGSIIVYFTIELGRLILLESGLSFLALGVQPPATSWGSMIADGRNYLFEAPWSSAIPGLVIVLFVIAINFFGDGLRDALDPRRC